MPSDGYLLLQQFGITQSFCADERVFGILNFTALLIASGPVFGYENPTRFIQDAVVGFAKKLMGRLETILEGDQEQLDQFIETISVRKTLSQSIGRHNLGTPATQTGAGGATPSRYNDSLRSNARPTTNTNTNMQSVPRSLVSNASRSPGSRMKPAPVPRVLVRDMSY